MIVLYSMEKKVVREKGEEVEENTCRCRFDQNTLHACVKFTSNRKKYFDPQWPSQKTNPFISYKHSKKPAFFKPHLQKDLQLYQGQIQDPELLQSSDSNSQDLII